jgi:nitroimidazol reductase NimA-like FMN-containing flavoprotein (pyridoxamine 5'-phosphate oxidase superfamily)
MSNSATPTSRTRVVRIPQRGQYDRATIDASLDEGFVCHVAFTVGDQPFVIPTGYGRYRDEIFVHGSAASRMIRAIEGGCAVCVTVTLVDGLVLARSAFHHSINYRSVVILGRARLVSDVSEKTEALRCFTNHVVENRWEEVRKPTAQELKATTVVAISLAESSAKTRSGPPSDDEADNAWPVWAGVIPLRVEALAPVPAEDLSASLAGFDVTRFERR